MPHMTLQLRDLAALDDAPTEGVGQPMSVAVGLIDEDPGQPRTEFDPQSLHELASTIADRGVCQPVSVRAHPDSPGRFMLNFGARRLRAARLAGKNEIPAFVADLGDGYAQVVENEQRDALKPMELALFVRRRIEAGESLAEIARRLGKTRGYLTFVTALIDAPEWLLQLYRSGKCQGMTELYELRRLHEARPQAVERWVQGRETISRSDLSAFKSEASPSVGARQDQAASDSVREALASTRVASPQTREGKGNRDRGERAKALALEADCGGSLVLIDLSAAPDEDGMVFVRAENGNRRAVRTDELRLLRVVAR
jgi:ParB family transcriptional regulator, chromosome partitioning protein